MGLCCSKTMRFKVEDKGYLITKKSDFTLRIINAYLGISLMTTRITCTEKLLIISNA